MIILFHLVLIFSKDVYEIPVKLIISCLEPVELSVEVREEEKMWITKDQVVGREKSPSFESLEDFFLGFVLSPFFLHVDPFFFIFDPCFLDGTIFPHHPTFLSEKKWWEVPSPELPPQLQSKTLGIER